MTVSEQEVVVTDLSGERTIETYLVEHSDDESCWDVFTATLKWPKGIKVEPLGYGTPVFMRGPVQLLSTKSHPCDNPGVQKIVEQFYGFDRGEQEEEDQHD